MLIAGFAALQLAASSLLLAGFAALLPEAAFVVIAPCRGLLTLASFVGGVRSESSSFPAVQSCVSFEALQLCAAIATMSSGSPMRMAILWA